MRLKLGKNQQPARLHAKLERFLRSDFFFLNIGANDGVSNDPIYPYLLGRPGWRGIAVEPVPHNFQQLQYNYRDFPKVALVNAAISETKKTFYYLDENCGCDLAGVSQISSFDRNYILESLSLIRKHSTDTLVTDDAEQHIREDDTINCMSLDELVESYDIEVIDFLNIDTENTNYEVFQMFDFERFKPTVICIETVDIVGSKREHFDQVIADFNYEFMGIFGIYSEVYARS